MESTENVNSHDYKLLVLQLQNKDIKAFDALFHKYSEKLFRFSFSLLKNKEDSKEIVQESFLRIWKKVNRLILQNHVNLF